MTKTSTAILTLTLAWVGFASQKTHGEDWPRFRGPLGNGFVKKIEHPLKWSADSNIAWKAPMAGGGLSSPVVAGDKIFITTAIGADLPKSFGQGVANMRPMLPPGPLEFQVACLDLKSGKKIWTKTLAKERPKHPIHSSNSFATESPAIVGNKLFVYFAAIGMVYGLDLEGNELWKKDIGSYPTGNGFGPGSSIVADDQTVFVQCDNDKSSFLVALDNSNGSEKWKKNRTGRTSWATPLLWKNEIRKELIVCGSGVVTSYDPATGKVIWSLSGISSSFSASPASDSERIYFGNSGPRSSGPLVAVSAGMSGKHSLEDGDVANVAWSKQRSGPGMSSPIVANGYLYVPGRGMISCYESKSGKLIYKERLPLKSSAASMWGGDGVVFLMDETGKSIAIKTGESFEIVATNQIDDLFWSTPSLAGKSLLLRGSSTIYCIR